MKVRIPAVAGLFYESDAEQLQQQVEALLAKATDQPHPSPQALIVPHAGYIYSGQVAAQAYAHLKRCERQFKRVALFGPAHRVYVEGMAIPSVEGFETPLGQVDLDSSALAIIKALPGVEVSDEAHRNEHCLEVQLPFLQSVLGDFKLVPVLVGHCEPALVATAMEALWRDPDTLLVISTDLSHFHAYDEARELDARTCARLLAKDNSLHGEDACGAHALNGLMSTERCHSLEIELLDMCNSGDTAAGRGQVVGYGAFSLH